MSEYVNETAAREAHKNGTKIGETEPTRETKGTWWEVFKSGEDIIACVMSEDGVVCGERITPAELDMYVDDTETAILNLARISA